MIWTIEQFRRGRWIVCDWERTRDAARIEMGMYRAVNKNTQFRIRKYVRQEP